MSKKKTSFRLSNEHSQKLQEIADSQFTSVSAIIRQAIDDKIKTTNTTKQ